MKRVLHVIDSLGPVGGAEQQLVANLNHMTDQGISHHLLCFYDVPGSRMGDLPDGVTVSVLSSEGQRERNRFALARAVHAEVRRVRPDLIHCSLPDAAMAARVAGRLTSTPVLESLVNISHERIRTTDNPGVTLAKLTAHRVLDRLTMGMVAHFHALSEAVAASWSKTVGIPRQKITVVGRGVDADELVAPQARARVRSEVRSRLGIADDAFLLVNVGRQVAQKGQLYAVRAMPLIVDSVPTALMISAGSEGPMSTRLRRETEELEMTERIMWLGPRSDIPELLAAGDVFVFPSLFEGLGVSLLQALGTGLACVTTAIPPMNTLVQHGVGGLTVPPQDPSALAGAIASLAAEPEWAVELGRQGRTQTLADFNIEQSASSIESLYIHLLGMETP